MSTPLGPPPLGGDDNRGPAVIAVTWAFTAISIFCVLARLYTRMRLTHNPGKDDIFIVISIIFGVSYTCLATVAVAQGNGRHPYYLGLAQTSKAIEWNSIAFIPGIVSLALPKLAVACLLIRLLNPSKLQRLVLYTLSISCIVFISLCAVFLWVQCTPSAGLWNPALNATCWQPQVVIDWSLFAGAYSAFVDLYLAVYPMVVLLGLEISLKKKLGLCFVLGFGLVATVIAIYKCTRLPELYDHTDYTYATVDLLIWTSVESNIIIIAACLPTLRPLFLVVSGRGLSSMGLDTPSNKRRSKYELHSISNQPAKGRARELYPLDSIDKVHQDDASVERILPPNRIRRDFTVSVMNDHAMAERGEMTNKEPYDAIPDRDRW